MADGNLPHPDEVAGISIGDKKKIWFLNMVRASKTKIEFIIRS